MVSIPSAISVVVNPEAYDPTENVRINAQTDCTRLSFQTWNIFICPWESTRSVGDIAVTFQSYIRNAVPPSPCKFNCVNQTSFLKCTVWISHKNTNSGECRPSNYENFLNFYFFILYGQGEHITECKKEEISLHSKFWLESDHSEDANIPQQMILKYMLKEGFAVYMESGISIYGRIVR